FLQMVTNLSVCNTVFLSFFFSLSFVLLYFLSFPTRRSSDRVFLVFTKAANGWELLMMSSDPLGSGAADGEGLSRPIPTDRCSSRSEEHMSELQSPYDLVCRLLLEKKKINRDRIHKALTIRTV